MTKVNLYYDQEEGCVRGVKPTYGEHAAIHHLEQDVQHRHDSLLYLPCAPLSEFCTRAHDREQPLCKQYLSSVLKPSLCVLSFDIALCRVRQ